MFSFLFVYFAPLFFSLFSLFVSHTSFSIYLRLGNVRLILLYVTFLFGNFYNKRRKVVNVSKKSNNYGNIFKINNNNNNDSTNI